MNLVNYIFILEKKAKEYNTDVIYEPGKLYFHFRK